MQYPVVIQIKAAQRTLFKPRTYCSLSVIVIYEKKSKGSTRKYRFIDILLLLTNC